jgi:hypothetical protein
MHCETQGYVSITRDRLLLLWPPDTSPFPGAVTMAAFSKVVTLNRKSCIWCGLHGPGT